MKNGHFTIFYVKPCKNSHFSKSPLLHSHVLSLLHVNPNMANELCRIRSGLQSKRSLVNSAWPPRHVPGHGVHLSMEPCGGDGYPWPWGGVGSHGVWGGYPGSGMGVGIGQY